MKTKGFVVVRPERARRLLINPKTKKPVSKPWFYEAIKAGKIKKVWPPGVPHDDDNYHVSVRHIEELNEQMERDWTRGKSLLPKNA